MVACGGGSSSTPTPPPVAALTVSPNSDTVGVGANVQFSVIGSGGASTNVTWSVNGTDGGSASSGVIGNGSNDFGLYIAPGTVPSPAAVTITASNGTQSASATVTVQASDPVGTVSSVQDITGQCPASSISRGQTCQQMIVACNGAADFTTYLKINEPTAPALGTVMFLVGTGGSGLYESSFTDQQSQFNGGTTVVQSVLDAGYRTVQVSFGSPFNENQPSGWLTGPGGVRRLACRFATVAKYIHDTIHTEGSTAPVCATGNSGGAGAIGYALSNYKLDGLFAMVETTSGPPMSDIAKGCLCNQGSRDTLPCNSGQQQYCYGVADGGIIDKAYSSPICTSAVNTGDLSNASLFESDSIDSPGANFNFPNTNVIARFGGEDKSAAVPLALEWYDQIASRKSNACEASAPHALPDDATAAADLASDIIANCKLP